MYSPHFPLFAAIFLFSPSHLLPSGDSFHFSPISASFHSPLRTPKLARRTLFFFLSALLGRPVCALRRFHWPLPIRMPSGFVRPCCAQTVSLFTPSPSSSLPSSSLSLCVCACVCVFFPLSVLSLCSQSLGEHSTLTPSLHCRSAYRSTIGPFVHSIGPLHLSHSHCTPPSLSIRTYHHRKIGCWIVSGDRIDMQPVQHHGCSIMRIFITIRRQPSLPHLHRVLSSSPHPLSIRTSMHLFPICITLSALLRSSSLSPSSPSLSFPSLSQSCGGVL